MNEYLRILEIESWQKKFVFINWYQNKNDDDWKTIYSFNSFEDIE